MGELELGVPKLVTRPRSWDSQALGHPGATGNHEEQRTELETHGLETVFNPPRAGGWGMGGWGHQLVPVGEMVLSLVARLVEVVAGNIERPSMRD